MTEKPDIAFVCRKCGHNMYVKKDKLEEKLPVLMKKDCPECGEDGYRNWVLSHQGDFNEDNGKIINT